MDEWLSMTACDLGRGIAAGRIDPVALAEAHLAAIETHPLSPRIFARVTRDRALAEAGAAAQRARAGRRRSLLDGVPISWKDLFDSAGIATEAGSRLLQGRTPARDAEVLRNATAMGTVCLGKTHMSELAFSGLGYNPSTATPPCVNDAAAVPGGSSSGAAASVAFGLAAGAIGSDTGGSVRVPAAWNDLVGLKTTSGRLSLEGVVPLCRKFDTVGPLARSVEDAAWMLAALQGGRAPDLRGAALQGRRLAVLRTVALEDLRDAPGAAFEAALTRLSAAGEVVDGVHQLEPPLHVHLDRIAELPTLTVQRVHGDFHLGQALRTPDGWKILDFEGEPGGELDSRRVLDHPMRDVAGMLRSFDYAAWQGGGNSDEAVAWGDASRAAFLAGYAQAGDLDPVDHEVLLTAYVIDKAAYEAVYEQRNRPDWIDIPLTALRAIAGG